MRISRLIKYLEDFRNKYGNVEVFICDERGIDEDVEKDNFLVRKVYTGFDEKEGLVLNV